MLFFRQTQKTNQGASVFIRPVLAIDVSVTEDSLLQTLPVSALKLTCRANRFVSVEVRLGQFRPSHHVAVVNTVTPVASLTFDVEVKT
jgi:hypothetical protein